jgi:hypothetical protein
MYRRMVGAGNGGGGGVLAFAAATGILLLFDLGGIPAAEP